MVKFLALLKLNFRAALAALRMGGRKRSVSGVGALVLLAGLSLYISGLHSFLFASQLAPAGALPLLIVFMSLGAVLLGFLFSLFAAQGMVFGTKDNDLMLALPVTPFALMLSRTLALYLENLISTLFVLLPAGVIYLWYGGPGGNLGTPHAAGMCPLPQLSAYAALPGSRFCAGLSLQPGHP